MGITYKELVLKHTGKIKKSPIGGVFGCPGGYMPGLPDILHNCRARENITSTFFCESCEQCWNTEVPFSLISNYIQEEEMKKEFVNDDLKDGMMVEDANGRKWLYLGGKLRKPGMCKDCKPDDICRFGYPDYERNFTITNFLHPDFQKSYGNAKKRRRSAPRKPLKF